MRVSGSGKTASSSQKCASGSDPMVDSGENPTRRRIIDATVASILETGFYRATSNEIARRACLTWGAIQRQFGTREALLLAAFQDEWQRLIDTMGLPIVGDTLQERVRRFFNNLKAHYSRPEYFAAMQIVINLRQDPMTSSATLDVIEQMSRKTAGMLPNLVQQIQPDTTLDSAVINTLFFTIRDFYIGVHVESTTALTEAFHRRLTHLAEEEELLIANLVTLVDRDIATTVTTAPSVRTPTASGRPRHGRRRRDGVSPAMLGRQLVDVAVAKYRPIPGGGLAVTYLCDAGEVHHARLTGLDAPMDPGRHAVMLIEGEDTEMLDWELTRRGDVYDLSVTIDGITLMGIGIADPQESDSLLVSWSWGADAATGVVKYAIADEPYTIIPTYTSTALAASGFDGVKGGRATGFTADGFPGAYTIVYDGLGATDGPFSWTVSERGTALELTWDTGTRRAMEGFGFCDPDHPDSIVAVYWSTGPRPRMYTPPACSNGEADGRS